MLRRLALGLGATILSTAAAGCMPPPHPVGPVAAAPVPAPRPTVMDTHLVYFPPFQTVRTVKCPVCNGSGSIQRTYTAYPATAAPFNPYGAP